MKSDLVDVSDIEFRLETEKAWMVLTSKGKEVWIPKSQCERNDDGSLTMPEWMATEKGLV